MDAERKRQGILSRPRWPQMALVRISVERKRESLEQSVVEAAMSEGKQEAREKQHCGCGTYYERTLEKCPDCGAANERRIIVGVTLSPERYNQLIQAESELADRQANQPQPREHNVNPQTGRCVMCGRNAFQRGWGPDCPYPEPQGKAQPEPLTQYVDEADLQAAFQRGQQAMANLFCETHLDTTLSDANVNDDCPLCVAAKREEAAFQNGAQAMAEKAAQLEDRIDVREHEWDAPKYYISLDAIRSLASAEPRS